MHVPLEEFTLEHFAPKIGAEFRVVVSEHLIVPLTLVQAVALPDARVGLARPPFSLLFSGSAETALGQNTYEVEIPECGSHPIFIVPISGGKSEWTYQVIFN